MFNPPFEYRYNINITKGRFYSGSTCWEEKDITYIMIFGFTQTGHTILEALAYDPDGKFPSFRWTIENPNWIEVAYKYKKEKV